MRGQIKLFNGKNLIIHGLVSLCFISCLLAIVHYVHKSLVILEDFINLWRTKPSIWMSKLCLRFTSIFGWQKMLYCVLH